jgi:type VI secretion system secreted protein Hcp
MAGDVYLYLDGIPGESTSKHFTNWIDVLSFSLGVSMEIDQEARESASGGITSGQADPQDISVETKMSIASPVLLQCCAAGAVIPRGRLIQCNVVNGKRLGVSDYAFGDSVISNVSISASGGAIPDESISINYGSIIWRYHCYNHFNPIEKLGIGNREWSIIQAKVENLDPRDNAFEALEIARVVAEKSDDDGHPYSSFDRGADGVNFKPGPVFYHDPDSSTKKERNYKPLHNKSGMSGGPGF